MAVTTIFTAIRLAGWLQFLELSAYDFLMNLRPSESWDENIVVIAATQNEQHSTKKKISDQDLNILLKKLQSYYQPKVIGIDTYRDSPNGIDDPKSNSNKDWESLISYMSKDPKIIAICRSKSKEEKQYSGINPPPGAKSEQLGFSDLLNDGKPNSGSVRRHLLRKLQGNSPCRTNFSLSYKVAEKYLTDEGYRVLKPDESNYLAFWNPKNHKKIVFPPLGITLRSDDGSSASYQKYGADWYNTGPYQVMLNYRAVGDKTPSYSFSEILNSSIEQEAIKNKIVLIGHDDRANSDRKEIDIQNTPIDSNMPGVIVQAHMTSQIINVVMGNRRLIWYIDPLFEILCIWGSSLLGGILIWRGRPLLWLGIIAFGTPVILGVACYLVFLQAGWLPFVPSAIGSFVTSVVMIVVDLRERDSIAINLQRRELNRVSRSLKP